MAGTNLVARRARLPSVDLVGNYYADRPDLDKNGAWDVGLAVVLPIFSGGITSSKVKTAESQKRQGEMQLSLVQRMALDEVRSLYHNLKSDMAQLAALKEAADVSAKNYEAIAKDYELNLVSNLDVLQSMTAYQDTVRSMEKIRYLAKIDYNKLEAAVARRLSLMKEEEKP